MFEQLIPCISLVILNILLFSGSNVIHYTLSLLLLSLVLCNVCAANTLHPWSFSTYFSSQVLTLHIAVHFVPAPFIPGFIEYSLSMFFFQSCLAFLMTPELVIVNLIWIPRSDSQPGGIDSWAQNVYK